jgi:hypothetical protein
MSKLAYGRVKNVCNVFTPALVISEMVVAGFVTLWQPFVARIDSALRIEERGVWAEHHHIHENSFLSPPSLGVSRVSLQSFLSALILPVTAGNINFLAREWAMFAGYFICSGIIYPSYLC